MDRTCLVNKGKGDVGTGFLGKRQFCCSEYGNIKSLLTCEDQGHWSLVSTAKIATSSDGMARSVL